MSHRGCKVAATTTAIPALASDQVWPSPARGMCTSGEAPGSGGRVGMVSFGAYVWYECVGIKVDKVRTIDMTQLLDCYVKGCARMHFCYGRLCPQPPDPTTVGKLKISAFSICVISLGCQTKSFVK